VVDDIFQGGPVARADVFHRQMPAARTHTALEQSSICYRRVQSLFPELDIGCTPKGGGRAALSGLFAAALSGPSRKAAPKRLAIFFFFASA